MALGLSVRNLGRVLSHHDFAAFTAGNFVSLVGTWMQRVAVGWLTWELTSSPTWLGVIAFADLAPAVLVGPFGGAAADRWDRLALMKFAQAAGLGVATLLAVLYGLGELTIWRLTAIVFLLGATDAFVQPARLAFTSNLVPPRDLATAVALKSVTFNAARFIGPAVAGIIIATLGTFWAFVGNAGTFAVFLFALARIRLRDVRLRRAGRMTVVRDTREGIAYAFSGQGVGTLLVLMVFSSFTVRPLIELLPAWAAEVFGGGAPTLAMLTSAIGIGAVLGGLWLASRTSPAGLLRATLVCCAGQAVTLFVFALTSSLPLALPLAVAGGLFLITGAIGAQTLVQINVADGMRGRVLGLYGLILRAFPALGAVLMGVASERFGLRLPLIAGTIVLVCFTGAVALRYRELRDKLEGGGDKTKSAQGGG